LKKMSEASVAIQVLPKAEGSELIRIVDKVIISRQQQRQFAILATLILAISISNI